MGEVVPYEVLQLTSPGWRSRSSPPAALAETERKLAELETANSQKDSLMQEVAISSRLISDVNAELAQGEIRTIACTSRAKARSPRRTTRCSPSCATSSRASSKPRPR